MALLKLTITDPSDPAAPSFADAFQIEAAAPDLGLDILSLIAAGIIGGKVNTAQVREAVRAAHPGAFEADS